MGRKVHPIGFRLGINRGWEARWFAEGTTYKELLHEDFRIRQWIMKGKYLPEDTKGGDNKKKAAAQSEGPRNSISKVEIERFPNLVVVTVFTSKPGILIGRKGETVKKLRTGLKDLTGKEVKVEVEEITKPDLDAKLIAENIAGQLERRIGHSRAMKRAISQAMRQGALGVRVEVSGRLGGAEMSRREWQVEGRVPRGTLRSIIDYGTAEALTTYGRLGVKVWVYTGMSMRTDAPAEETTPKQQDAYVSQ
jgi:small subunit ribosomal protein S3